MSPTVLVVDDEADIRELIRINLEHRGYLVQLACDGAEALDAVRHSRPDAVCLDVMMPGIDGWGVLNELKQSGLDELAEIPILMVTAKGEDLDQLRGRIDGALRYITKPFAPAELVQALEEVLNADGTEREQRLAVQRRALVELARRERGVTGNDDRGPVVRLTRLERVHTPVRPRRAAGSGEMRLRLGSLSEKQRGLLTVLAGERSVSVAAGQLGVSRSNVYASLRRIARKLGLKGTAELLALIRSGELATVNRSPS